MLLQAHPLVKCSTRNQNNKRVWEEGEEGVYPHRQSWVVDPEGRSWETRKNKKTEYQKKDIKTVCKFLFELYLVNTDDIPNFYLKMLATAKTLIHIVFRKDEHILGLWNYIFYIYKKDGVVLKLAVEYMLLFRAKFIFLIKPDLFLSAEIINTFNKRVRYVYRNILLPK